MLAKRHNGSGILPYPEEVQALLSRLITEYPQISFSIKMRLGWEDPEECLKLAPIINEPPPTTSGYASPLGKTAI